MSVYQQLERRADLLDALLKELSQDLSDCPFCGEGEAEVTPGINNCWVQCGHCHTSGPAADTPQEAARFWNQRKTTTNPTTPRMSDRQIIPTTDMQENQTATRNSGSLDALVRRITDKWEELDDNCEYRNLPRERMEAMLTAELAGLCAEYEAAYKRLHSQVSGYLHGEEWEHWQKYNEPRFAPNNMSTEHTTPIDDGGPAFPQPLAFSPSGAARVASEYFQNVEGMSLRDWFAGQALAGMCGNPKLLCEDGQFHSNNFKACFEIADAMLAARKGGEK